MHIAFFADYHPDTLGGVQTAVDSLRRGLARAGHRVTLFVPPQAGGGAASAEPDVVELRSISLALNGLAVVAPGARNDALVDAEFAARGPFDVVHTHSTYGVAIIGMKAARRHRIPLIHTAHSRDDAFIRETSPAPYATALALRALHGRYVPHAHHMPHRAESRAARHAWWTMSGQAQAADRVIVPTRHFADLMVAHGLTKPIRVISNGVDDAVLEGLEPQEHPVDGPLRLIWCGRLSAEKRFLEALDAVRRSPHSTLDIYGDGDLRGVAAAYIAENRLGERIRLHGKVSSAACLEAMTAADALLFPSSDFETQGMVLLEAVAVGLPVIYCDPVLDETVPAGGGFRSADHSVEALADAIAKLAADRSALAGMRAVLGEHAGSVRQSRYTAAVLKVYTEAVDKAAQRPAAALPRTLSEIPSAPGGLPLVGHSLQALRNAPGFVTAVGQLGPIVRMRFGRKTGYILTTPELVRQVAVSDAEFEREDLREAIEDVAGGSVNVLRGAEHKLRRRMISPSLRQSRLAQYSKSASDIANAWSAGLPAGGRVNLMDEAHGLVLDTVSSTLFTAEFSASARHEIRDNIPWLLSQVIIRTAMPPQIRRLRVISNWRWRTKARHLRRAVGAVIAEYRRRDEDFNDVVSALIRHTDPETGATLSDDHIIDEAILMLAGGVGSMASLAGWLWHEVMRHPEVAERLYAELDAVVGPEGIRPADLEALPYLKQVVAETIRFWGPWISAANSVADLTIGEVTIPAGSAIMFSPYMVQHDPHNFPHPEHFDPDRWSPERADDTAKKASLSFGVGRRRCLGDHFAMLEIALASAALLARWRPVPDPDYTVRPSNRDFVLSPSAIPVTLHPRERTK
ncbi:cytochrome P450 [Nocardia huaxiensis]|uniref:cytochrome P450 n=1 Tax=Nocardia huaxiensis TaxID=2755382 RepID=UPI001E49AB3F|nr:cytochrome P450 [Nocardia huaxiensis]UFS99778.1 cytochrome P450 [Nocardia huaxiensis]